MLVRSRLLAAEEVQKVHRRWRMEHQEIAGDRDEFARWLIANEYVTDYQASILLRGYTDNFFLGHYKILSRIGKGRMAGVYKAVHNLGTIVAIKVLPPSRARNPRIFARFQREARMALRLQHPNVVRTFQLGGAEGLSYLVMEYLEGETLEELLGRRAKISVGEAVRLIHQALTGLQHIHEKGMVHRDLKPANLMLVNPPEGAADDTSLKATVKILDIGLGRDLFDEQISKEGGQIELTSEGAVLGTPDYLAPEQARNAHSADVRADIYSLGCVLYRILTGKRPFPDKNVFQQVLRHATEDLQPIGELEPTVPEGLQRVISRMVAKNPKQRYSSPDQAAKALLEFVPGHEPSRPPEPEPQMRTFLQWVEQHQEEIDFSSVEENSPPLASVYQLEPLSEPLRAPTPIHLSLPTDSAESIPTTVLQRDDSDSARSIDRSLRGLDRRDYFLLAIGIWLGAAVVLLVEGIVWLIMHAHR